MSRLGHVHLEERQSAVLLRIVASGEPAEQLRNSKIAFSASAHIQVLASPVQDNTAGQFNERLYRYGVSLKAQEPREKESCYRINI